MSKIICICNRVTEEEIAKIVSKHPIALLQDVIIKTAASTSCGRCRSELESVFETQKQKYLTDEARGQLSLPFDFSGPQTP
ncbi:bacterioferritin-associated ferredoxin [Marinilabilia sp.]|uniref:(2Fe-2S)-binding protein n=1 Tax=Marinilabilia sp. TaxID=2021252 RepID=UPI0025BDEDCA|nr:(2Fe-2S)-binding protein [Marinilabilia sp.]